MKVELSYKHASLFVKNVALKIKNAKVQRRWEWKYLAITNTLAYQLKVFITMSTMEKDMGLYSHNFFFFTIHKWAK
jgi:hypothetical protein